MREHVHEPKRDVAHGLHKVQRGVDRALADAEGGVAGHLGGGVGQRWLLLLPGLVLVLVLTLMLLLLLLLVVLCIRNLL